MARVRMRPGWQETVESSAPVRANTERVARAIADDARERTRRRSGKAAATIRVRRDGNRFKVLAGGERGFHFFFQEFGGKGFRPPPMPLRRAAAKYGRYRDSR